MEFETIALTRVLNRVSEDGEVWELETELGSGILLIQGNEQFRRLYSNAPSGMLVRARRLHAAAEYRAVKCFSPGAVFTREEVFEVLHKNGFQVVREES